MTHELRSNDHECRAVDCLINARWIAPVVPKGVVLAHHSVAIDGHKIVALLPTDEVACRYTADQNVDLFDHLLIPGLINAHGHAAMSLLRGYADDRELMDWLANYIWPVEEKHVSHEFVHDGASLAIAEMLRGGTTCMSDMYFFPHATAEAIHENGIRAQVCVPIASFTSPWANDEDDYIHKGLQFHDDHRNSDLITTALGPHSPYAVSDKGLARIVILAEELDIPIQIHLHETRGEIAKAVSETGQRPASRLFELGMFSPRLQVVHVTHLNKEEIDRLAENAVQVIHCPESNLKLASGFCPVGNLLQHGINVALGTDGAASNNGLDMLHEMKTASILAKACAEDPTVLDAHTTLEMATLSGAIALGIDEQVGSIEPGKLADITAINLENVHTLPVYHPVSQLVYTNVSRDVSHVWVNGELLLDEGNLTRVDPAQIRAVAHKWQQKLH